MISNRAKELEKELGLSPAIAYGLALDEKAGRVVIEDGEIKQVKESS